MQRSRRDGRPVSPPAGPMNLAEKVDPRWAALAVIDYQNDFCDPRGAFAKTGFDPAPVRAIAPALRALVRAARGARVPLIWVQNAYTYGTNWYLSDVTLEQARRKWRGRYITVPVCAAGSWGTELYGGLRIRPEDAVVTKHRFNAMVDTDLDLILRSRRFRTLIAAGILTNICVESTVRDAFFKDYYPVVPRDCVATYEKAQHEAALANIDTFFGQVTTSADIVAAWRGRRRGGPS